MMLQTDSSAPNRLDMVSRERDLKKEKREEITRPCGAQ